MYFDIRIGVIRVETVKQFKYLKIEKFKKNPRNIRDLFSRLVLPGLKGPPAPAYDPSHVEDL
jgi:hypothetical protein